MGPKPHPQAKAPAKAKAHALAMANEQYINGDVAYMTGITQLDMAKDAAYAKANQEYLVRRDELLMAKAKAYAEADQHGLPHQVPPKCYKAAPPPRDVEKMPLGERKALSWVAKPAAGPPQNDIDRRRVVHRNATLVKSCHKASLSSTAKYRRLSTQLELNALSTQEVLGRVLETNGEEQAIVNRVLESTADSMP
eukprot:GEMP01048747.1.p1 GENE.GEMP01048747.1~~GEMP01048747.1.p1  ORF type:complete len:195 (-),score=28.47 GEMP01048747.1:1065-1649(-)